VPKPAQLPRLLGFLKKGKGDGRLQVHVAGGTGTCRRRREWGVGCGHGGARAAPQRRQHGIRHAIEKLQPFLTQVAHLDVPGDVSQAGDSQLTGVKSDQLVARGALGHDGDSSQRFAAETFAMIIGDSVVNQ
jgi:hypothetical protein